MPGKLFLTGSLRVTTKATNKERNDDYGYPDGRLGPYTGVLAFSTPERQFPSETLARSVNTNPVVVRRLMGVLKKADLIAVRRGKGGPSLALPPEKITLLDVYKAILPADKRCPFQVHRAPSPRCFAGKNIHDALEMPFAKARNALEESLSTTTIADIAAFIRVRMESEQA